uniref:Uncharacterized protein n=1 Tax=Vitrella brassicaformis TaxID=1169539 RepID=A0A6U4JI70_9ALVE
MASKPSSVAISCMASRFDLLVLEVDPHGGTETPLAMLLISIVNLTPHVGVELCEVPSIIAALLPDPLKCPGRDLDVTEGPRCIDLGERLDALAHIPAEREA